jgi:hypothetical protein
MEFTEQHIRDTFEKYNEIKNKVEEIFDSWNAITNKVDSSARIIYFEQDGNFIDIYWEATWGYGGHDTGSITLPLSYLWDDHWEDTLKAELIVKQEKYARKVIEQQKANALKKEQEDRELFEKLKAKFGEE